MKFSLFKKNPLKAAKKNLAHVGINTRQGWFRNRPDYVDVQHISGKFVLACGPGTIGRVKETLNSHNVKWDLGRLNKIIITPKYLSKPLTKKPPKLEVKVKPKKQIAKPKLKRQMKAKPKSKPKRQIKIKTKRK